VDTWGKWADQLVIVDGGTTDNTYSVLKDWTTARNYEIIGSPETYWDTKCSHAGQWGINTSIGLARLQTDWAFIVPADHILDLTTVDTMRQELNRHNHCYGGRFIRKRFRGYEKTIEIDNKWYVMNLKKIRSEGLPINWGADRIVNTIVDYPVAVTHHTSFTDPANGAVKQHLSGIKVPLPFSLPLTCWSYGFYFYSLPRALEHLREFHTLFSIRYCRQPPKNDALYLRSAAIDTISSYLNKAQELQKPHIPEVKRLIDHFFHPGMLGSAIASPRRTHQVQTLLQRFTNRLSAEWLGIAGFRGLRDVQVWRPTTESPVSPLDVRLLYKQQDTHLPPAFRIDWDRVDERCRAHTAQPFSRHHVQIPSRGESA
jgi:hypothetical protein